MDALGLPDLGRQVGSYYAGESLSHGHKAVSSITEEPFSPLDLFQNLRLRDVWGDMFRSIASQYATASDIQMLTRFLLIDASLQAAQRLPGLTVEFVNGLSVFQLRTDIRIVTSAGVPIGVVKVKKPPSKSDAAATALDDVLLAGEVYDYLLRLRSFHGLRHCFGIVTNYLSWRIFWLPSDQTNELAAAKKVWRCTSHCTIKSNFDVLPMHGLWYFWHVRSTFYIQIGPVSTSEHAVVFVPGVEAGAADIDADADADEKFDSELDRCVRSFVWPFGRMPSCLACLCTLVTMTGK